MSKLINLLRLMTLLKNNESIVYWLNKYQNDEAYILESHTNKKIKYDKL